MKILRITTVPLSLAVLLKGQLRFMKSIGFEVVAASSPGSEVADVEAFEGVKHHAFPLTRAITPFIDLVALIKLTGFLRREQFTIVHTHTPKAGLIGMLAAWRAGVPVRMHTVAGIPWMESKGLKRWLLRFVEKVTYASAHQIYPNSLGLAEFIKEERLCSPKKLKVIGSGSSNGINTSYFQPDRVSKTKQDLREEWGIPEKAFVFVFIGRLVGDKGIHELATAFQEVLKKHSHVRLLLVGPFEDERDPVNSETKTFLKNTSQIMLTGFQKDVRPFLKMADALVFPSYREGLPNVPMQAGAMELPAIVTNINGCNEIIEHKVNGLIVPVKDAVTLTNAMVDLLENQSLYDRLQRNSRARIVERYEQQHVWESIYQEYLWQLRNKGLLTEV